MKSHVASSEAERKRIKTECRKHIYKANEDYNTLFDVEFLLMLHRVLKFGKKRLQRIFTAMTTTHEAIRDEYMADKPEDEIYAAKYRLLQETGIDIEKWEDGIFD